MKTADIALASTLALWIPINNIERIIGSKRALFVFEDTEKTTLLVEQYWRGELRIEPRSYFDQLRALKARLYE